MRARAKSILPVTALLLGLAACTPDGYTDSPAMGAYFSQFVPEASKDGVKQVSVCSYDDKWYASVYFADKNLYHYQLELDTGAAKLERMSTAAQRKLEAGRGWGVDLECIGAERGDSFDGFKERGAYRFEIGRMEFGQSTVTGHVRKSIVVKQPFNDVIKQRLRGAALAVQKAVQDHKQYVPVEASWGVKP